MKCVTKLPVVGSLDMILEREEGGEPKYEELLFDISISSSGTKEEREKDPNGGFVIGMLRRKGNAMFFLDFAERLYRLLETPQAGSIVFG